jgi:membrane protease YdiL (CAAX protease family)
MVVDLEVTRDVPTRKMQPEPVTAPEPPPTCPFGAWRALRILLAFLGVQVAVAVAAGLRAFLATRASPGAPDALLVTAMRAAVVGAGLGALCVVAMVRREFARPGGDALRGAIGWTGASVGACARAAALGLALAAASLLFGALSHAEPRSLGPLARASGLGGSARAMWALLALVIAPPSEELVFRGVLHAGFARSWGVRAAAVLTTALFVGLHATEIRSYAPGWIVIAALGALALRARLRTGSLAPPIALHVSYNLALVIAIYGR